jgi:ribosomal protein L3 glutamine methyltransferase
VIVSGLQDKDALARLKTVRDVLRYAVSTFGAHQLSFGHGSNNPWDEAVYLILSLLHLPLSDLDPYLDARLTRAEVQGALEVIARRATGVPAAYLTHEAWLGEYRFYVDERVIVPRSFIAELLFEGLAPWVANPSGVGRVLDLCTGSGCLAIIAAEVFPNAKVDAVDGSLDALEVARINVDRYELKDRIKLIHSDLFDAVGATRYDLILSNPPYVNSAAMAALPPEYRHEPALALAGGPDGLDVVARIMERAPAHLARRIRNPGQLIVEIGHERAAFEARYPQFRGTWLSTSAGDDMVFRATRTELSGHDLS